MLNVPFQPTLSRPGPGGEVGHSNVCGVVEAEADAEDEDDGGRDLDGEAAEVGEAIIVVYG